MTDRTVVAAAARAIVDLDQVSFHHRSEADRQAIEQARQLLFSVLERNGYEMSEPLSPRIRKARAGSSR